MSETLKMYSTRLNSISLLLLIFLVSSSHVKSHYVVTKFDDYHPVVFDRESGTPYKNCGGSESILKSVQIIPCDELSGGYCVIKRGGNATCNLSFEAEENSTTLTAKIYGIIAFVPVPFPCPQPDACENSGIKCPMMKGQFYNYTITAPVLEKYPTKKLWVKGELKDDNGNIITCIEVPVKIE